MCSFVDIMEFLDRSLQDNTFSQHALNGSILSEQGASSRQLRLIVTCLRSLKSTRTSLRDRELDPLASRKKSALVQQQLTSGPASTKHKNIYCVVDIRGDVNSTNLRMHDYYSRLNNGGAT